MLLRDKSGHLLLDGGHLFIKLPQPPHEVTIAVDFRRERAVSDTRQRRVYLCKLMPRGQELSEVLWCVVAPLR